MNKLYPIPLLGQGTAEIESLSSYVLRLAFEHGASGGTFLSAIAEMSGHDSRSYRSVVAHRHGIGALSRVNASTDRLRLLLAELTGQNLFSGALQFLGRNAFLVSADIGGIRWCPECFCEMSEMDTPRYIKQLWQMKVVCYCPLHRTALESQCSQCRSEQRSARAAAPVGWCMKCGLSLAKRGDPLLIKDIIPSWECMSFDLVEIFSKTSRDSEEQNCTITSRDYIEELTSRLQEMFIERRPPPIGLDLMQVASKPRGGNSRLTTLRRLAYMMNMSLYEMLTRPFDVLRLPCQVVNFKYLPDQIKVRKKLTRNHQREHYKILFILENQLTPPSLKQLARLAKVSIGYLEYRFPGLVRKVVDRHKSYQEQQYLKRRYRAQTAALKFFTDERYATHTQSRKEAYRVLREETGLPKWVLMDAIQVAYRAICG